jgi:hypothetical protein
MTDAAGNLTKQQLEQRCRKVIGEAIAKIENAPDDIARSKWRIVRDTWQELLNNVRFGPRPKPEG